MFTRVIAIAAAAALNFATTSHAQENPFQENFDLYEEFCSDHPVSLNPLYKGEGVTSGVDVLAMIQFMEMYYRDLERDSSFKSTKSGAARKLQSIEDLKEKVLIIMTPEPFLEALLSQLSNSITPEYTGNTYDIAFNEAMVKRDMMMNSVYGLLGVTIHTLRAISENTDLHTDEKVSLNELYCLYGGLQYATLQIANTETSRKIQEIVDAMQQ